MPVPLWNTGVLAALGKLASGTMLIAGIAALIAAFAVVGGLIGQLKQASSQSSASGYARDGGLDLQVEFDHYLYTKTNRRKIEKKEEPQSKEA